MSNARLSRQAVETLHGVSPSARLSRQVVEALHNARPSAVLSRNVVEVLFSTGVAGDLAATLPVPTASFSGSYTPPPDPPIGGTLAGVLPVPTASFSGDYTGPPAPVDGNLTVTLPVPTVSFSGSYTTGLQATGSFAATNPRVVASFTGSYVGVPGTGVKQSGEAWGADAVAADGGDVFISEPVPEFDFENYTGSSYRYFTFDIISDLLLAELDLQDVSFSIKLGSVGEFSATISTADVDLDTDLFNATMPMKTALYVLRDKVAVWGGIIWSRNYDATTRTLTLSGATWESYLFRRHIWHTFTTDAGTDQLEVIRELIKRMRRDFKSTYLASDNVTPRPDAAAIDIFTRPSEMSGELEPAHTFVREDMKTFGEAIRQLSDNLNGFEWYIQVDYNERKQRFRRRFRFLPTPPSLLPKGSPEPENNEADKPGIDTYIFDYPGSIVTLSLDEDADNAGTRQFVVGGPPAGFDTDYKPIGSWNNNAYMDAGWPLVETVEASKHHTTTRIGRLNKLATVYGRESAPPIRTWSVTVNGSMDPIVGSYRVGHWCRLVIDDPFIAQSVAASGADPKDGVIKRIVGYTVNVPAGSMLPEMVTLELQDDPVVSFELPGANDEV